MRSFAISRCRVCGGDNLREVFSLGDLVSCGAFPSKSEPDPTAAPLSLVQCDPCGLVQLAHNFDGNNLFRNSYGYRSGINESMVRHLREIAFNVRQRVRFSPGDIVLDIGSNDGTSLSFYEDEKGLRRIGIDPTIAKFKSYYQPGIETVDEFFTAAQFRKSAGSLQAKAITSIAMLYDLPDPNIFVADIASVLAPDGLWVFEQSYLPLMVERGSFDTICHEHLEYYGMHQINDLLARHGLRAFDVRVNDVNGGSFQIWACHAGGPYPANAAAVDLLLRKERLEGYLGDAPLQSLRTNTEAARKQTLDFLEQCVASGKVVHGYGASTKGNTLLQYFGITPRLLPAIADRNADKEGARTPGTGIPIISEEQSRAKKPDYYFVLPWHFRDVFLEREKAFMDRGGKFVFPLPVFDIVAK
jgi:NDP-4-keto-2,6-dideoxyhexose 3-C-methyltransferase